MGSSIHDITVLLQQAATDPNRLNDLFRAVEQRLRGIAVALLKHERPDADLQPTILVDDAFMRLTRGGKPDWKDRAHFFCAAARVMRHWVIDYARSRKAQKRGRAAKCVSLESQPEPCARRATAPERFLELDEALQRLEQELPAASEVFHLRHFLECTPLEIAGILGIETRDVQNRWRQALKFLREEMGEWATA